MTQVFPLIAKSDFSYGLCNSHKKLPLKFWQSTRRLSQVSSLDYKYQTDKEGKAMLEGIIAGVVFVGLFTAWVILPSRIKKFHDSRVETEDEE